MMSKQTAQRKLRNISTDYNKDFYPFFLLRKLICKVFNPNFIKSISDISMSELKKFYKYFIENISIT